MASVLELGGQGNRFAWDENAIPVHVLIGQYGLVGIDNDVAFPSLISIVGGIMDAHMGTIGNTRNN